MFQMGDKVQFEGMAGHIITLPLGHSNLYTILADNGRGYMVAGEELQPAELDQATTTQEMRQEAQEQALPADGIQSAPPTAFELAQNALDYWQAALFEED